MPSKNKSGCRCCDTTCSGTTRICATVTDGCTTPGPVNGATVTVKDHTGATVGTCTTTGQVASLTLVSSGSGYTNGTGYAIAFTGGGGTGAAGTFDVVAGGITNLVLTSGGSGYTSAPSLGFAAAGGGASGNASATIGSQCCVAVSNSGTYTVTASVSGFASPASTVSVVCNTDNLVSVNFQSNTLGYLNGNQLYGCQTGTGLAGITVAATQNGVTQTATSTSSGTFSFPIPFVVYDAVLRPYPVTLTFTDPNGRFVTQTTSLNISGGCTTATFGCLAAGIFEPSDCVGLNDVAAGYHCEDAGFNSCSYPIADTLTLSDGLYGTTVSLTYQGCDGGGTHFWQGTQSLTIPACTTAASVCTPAHTLTCPAVTLTVTYTFCSSVNGETLEVSWTNNRDQCCPPGTLGGCAVCPGSGTNNSSGSTSFVRTSITCAPAYNWVSAVAIAAFVCGDGRLYYGSFTMSITE